MMADTMICPESLRLGLRPSVFFLVILSQSSVNPMQPKPRTAKRESQVKLFLKSCQRRTEMTMAKIIRIPPMVGVPSLTR